MNNEIRNCVSELATGMVRAHQNGITLQILVTEQVSKAYLAGVNGKDGIREFNKLLKDEVGSERYKSNKAVVSKAWKCILYFCIACEDDSLAVAWSEQDGPGLLEMYQKIPGNKAKASDMEKIQKAIVRLSTSNIDSMLTFVRNLLEDRRAASERSKSERQNRIALVREVLTKREEMQVA